MEKEITKICKHHGSTLFTLEHDHYYRCKKCRSSAVTRWRQRTKLRAIEYRGGKCNRCGYNKSPSALDFHHIDGSKEFGIAAQGQGRSWDRIKKELDKCELVCANCHREIHAE